jgi:hypothetical protein
VNNLIAALEKWKEAQVGRLPATIELICPQCKAPFSSGFSVPEKCPGCQALLLQPRSAGSRVFAIIAIGVLAVGIPAAIYFGLGSLSKDPALGRIALFLVQHRTIFFFVSLAIVVPLSKEILGLTKDLFAGLLGHAVSTDTEKHRLSRFFKRLQGTKGHTWTMRYWLYCRVILMKGPPYAADSKPYGEVPASRAGLVELASDLEIVGILLYLLSGGKLGNPAATLGSSGPYPGWIQTITHDSPALTQAAREMRAVANESEQRWLNWLGENFLQGDGDKKKGAPEFWKAIKSYI